MRDRPQHRELRPLLFSNSVWVLLRPTGSNYEEFCRRARFRLAILKQLALLGPCPLSALFQTARGQKHPVILRMSRVFARCKVIFFFGMRTKCNTCQQKTNSVTNTSFSFYLFLPRHSSFLMKLCTLYLLTKKIVYRLWIHFVIGASRKSLSK